MVKKFDFASRLDQDQLSVTYSCFEDKFTLKNGIEAILSESDDLLVFHVNLSVDISVETNEVLIDYWAT